ATKGACLMHLVLGTWIMGNIGRYEWNDPGANGQQRGIGEGHNTPGEDGDTGDIGTENQAPLQGQPWAVVGMVSPCPTEDLELNPQASEEPTERVHLARRPSDITRGGIPAMVM